MGNVDSADRTEPMLVRVAFVQLDYQPQAVLAYPFIEEPGLLAEGDVGLTSLHSSLPLVEQRISAFRKEVALEYDRLAGQRAGAIVERLNELDIDLAVFPEYSIPASILPSLGRSAGKYTLVAASHTVTARDFEHYRTCAMNLSETDIGKSICPVRLPDGRWQRIDKLTRSRWETRLKQGSHWHPVVTSARSGKEFRFGVFLCVDFINENDPNYQKTVPRDAWASLDFAVVPSYSPTVQDFEYRAAPLAKRLGKPVIFANVASVGGSCIYCTSSETGAFMTQDGTRPLAPGDETVIVVDLVLGPGQFALKPTPLPTPPTSRVVAVLPVIPAGRFSSFTGLMTRVEASQSDDQKRAVVQEAETELQRFARIPGVPAALKAKTFALLEGMSWQDGPSLESLVDHIALPEGVSDLNETRFELLYKAQELLATAVRDPRIRDEELEEFGRVLSVYRRSIDALRPHVQPELVQKLEASDPAIHTTQGDTPSPTFTSMFMMRLKSARVHRAALEKQIRLISTIAHEGNAHLSLNLRYVSLPNPGGNLKNLEVQVLGAARASDRADSRKIADSFRRDLANLMRVTLQDAYLFELEELDPSRLSRSTEPFQFNHVAELSRQVAFGVQPYIDNAALPSIRHLDGSSSLARVLDLLQSSSQACMVSIHLHPVALSETEETFFRTCERASSAGAQANEGAMFFLGTERHPALRLGDAVTMQRLLGHTEGLGHRLFLRMFVASDQPISQLLLNTVGNELWGNDTYQIDDFSDSEDDRYAIAEALRNAWALDAPLHGSAPAKLERIPFLFDPYEACRAFRLPLEGHSGSARMLFAVIPAPAAALPDDGTEIGLGFHYGAQKPIVVRLADKERAKHTYIIGKTGTGKSTLLARMIEQDMRRGGGVCVIDPHGDLIDTVLDRVPDGRESDVVLLDPSLTDNPFGLNLLEYNPEIPHHREFVVQETISIMRKLFYFEHGGPVFEHNLRHLVLTVLDESMGGEGTLVEVPRLLYDDDFRSAVVHRLRDELAKDFWEQYRQLTPHTKSEQLYYIVSKFDTFTIDRLMRNTIGQSRSTINIADLMGDNRILLVKLPSALIGELNAALLGMIIISKLRWAGMARASRKESDRAPYYVYVDEFQNFAASGFETILAEARKYGLCLTVAHQYADQLSAFNITTGRIEDRVAKAVFGNAATLIAFRVGVSDAELMAKEMGDPVEPEDLENLKNYHALVKTVFDGDVYPPFTIRTLPSDAAENPTLADAIRKESLTRYGRPRSVVEDEIRNRKERILAAT